MALRDWLGAAVTPATAATHATDETAWGADRSNVAAVAAPRLPQEGEVQEAEAASDRWLIRFDDQSAVELVVTEAITRGAVCGRYPAALAVEPIERGSSRATEQEAAELGALIAIVGADWPDDEGAEASAAALADSKAALPCFRALAAELEQQQ